MSFNKVGVSDAIAGPPRKPTATAANTTIADTARANAFSRRIAKV
jgi:hypothetical protein